MGFGLTIMYVGLFVFVCVEHWDDKVSWSEVWLIPSAWAGTLFALQDENFLLI